MQFPQTRKNPAEAGFFLCSRYTNQIRSRCARIPSRTASAAFRHFRCIGANTTRQESRLNAHRPPSFHHPARQSHAIASPYVSENCARKIGMNATAIVVWPHLFAGCLLVSCPLPVPRHTWPQGQSDGFVSGAPFASLRPRPGKAGHVLRGKDFASLDLAKTAMRPMRRLRPLIRLRSGNNN